MVGAETYSRCLQLQIQLWDALDRRAFGEFIELMTPDGRWRRGANWLHGSDEIRAALAERPAERETRHFVTHLMVSPAAQAWRCDLHLLHYEAVRPAGVPGFLPIGAHNIVRCSCICVEVEGRLLVQEHTADFVFKRTFA